MTILLYEYCELEERSSKSLKVWKAWHLILYACAAVFGILNFVFLQNTMHLVDENCVLFPRLLEFHMVSRNNHTAISHNNDSTIYVEDVANKNENNTAQMSPVDTGINVTKREASDNETSDNFETSIEVNNVTIITGNKTHQLVLDTSRSLFGGDTECQFAEFMPILSTIFCAVWLTLFTMCPGGGRVRTGLPEPWRILTPALLFALIMVGLTGHSFTTTNGGLHAFCAAFHNVTNSTNCAPVNEFLVLGWNATWGFGGRAAATRAASAGVWASWACAAALMLARCLTAPDFQVKKSGVYLSKDPAQKITPFLKKTRSSNRSSQKSPTKHDIVSIRSEPTVTTELATASVEPGQDSARTSFIETPRRERDGNTKRDSEIIELADTPQERGVNGLQ